MKDFNGNWFGYERDEELNYEKTTVLSIQYMGERSWAFQIRYAAVRENPEELFDFVLKEDEPTKMGLSFCRGLFGLGRHISWNKVIYLENQEVLTELTVDKDHPSKLSVKTVRNVTMGTGLPFSFKRVYYNKFQIDLDSNKSRVLTHGYRVETEKGKPVAGIGELLSGMVECAVSARDAIFGRLVKANRGEMDEYPEGVESEEESSLNDAEESAFEEESSSEEDAGPVEDMQEPN